MINDNLYELLHLKELNRPYNLGKL